MCVCWPHDHKWCQFPKVASIYSWPLKKGSLILENRWHDLAVPLNEFWCIKTIRKIMQKENGCSICNKMKIFNRTLICIWFSVLLAPFICLFNVSIDIHRNGWPMFLFAMHYSCEAIHISKVPSICEVFTNSLFIHWVVWVAKFKAI